MSESTMIPGNQTTRRELMESTLNTGNQATKAEVSEYTINSSNQRTSTEQTELTLNTDNQATGIDSRQRGLTMQNILNQETVAVQANLVKMKDIAMVNMGKQTVIINPSDEGSVHEAVGEIENRISQNIDELKQTVIYQSKVIESQSKEIESQREVMKQLIDRDDNPRRRSMIENTKAKIVWGTRGDFVPTKAFEDAKTKLLQQKIVIIKGNIGDGKHRTALELLSWMWKRGKSVDDTGNETYHKQPIQVYSFNDLGKTVDPNLNLCIFIDDVSTDLFNEIERNEESIMSLISGQINGKSNCLVITVRNDVFKRMSSNIIFVDENVVDTSSKKYHIKKEKRQILDIYLPKEPNFSNTEISEIVECAPDIGFPQCCRLYRDVPELQKQGVKFFHKPLYFVKNALSKLEPGRCAALLYLFLCGGRVLEKDFDPSNDKIDNTLLEEVFDVDLVEVKITGQLGHKKKVQFIHESLHRLSGSLVTKEKPKMLRDNDGICYRFSYDSVKDTVALLYGEVTPIGFIQNCHCNSLCYITTSKTTPNKIFIDPANYIYMYRRLLRELECKQSENYKCIASIDIWDDIQFMSGFFRLLKAEGIDKDLYRKWTTKDVDGSYHFYTDRGDKYKGSMYLTESDDSDSSESSDMYFPSFLVYVAHTKNLRLLKQLLKRIPKDHPQLHCVLFGVVRAGHFGVFKMIIKKGICTVMAKRSQSSHYIRYINVLHEACLFERVEMVTKLATKYPSLVQDTCRDGICFYKLSTFHIVALVENCSLFDTIETITLGDLSREDRVTRLTEMVNGYGMTVLGYSCCLCNSSNTMVLHLLHKYPELASIRDEEGWHCLHYIAHWSNKNLFIQVNSFLQSFYKDKGINYDMTTIVNNDGESVLDMAKIGFRDDEDMCSYLSQS